MHKDVLLAQLHSHWCWVRITHAIDELLAHNRDGGNGGFLSILKNLHLDGLCQELLLCQRGELEDLNLVLELHHTRAHLTCRLLVSAVGTDSDGITPSSWKTHDTIRVDCQGVGLRPSTQPFLLNRYIEVRPQTEAHLHVPQDAHAALYPEVRVQLYSQLEFLCEQHPCGRCERHIEHLQREVMLLAKGCVEVHGPSAIDDGLQTNTHGALELPDVEDLHVHAHSRRDGDWSST
mmetsp:Transcript_94258/g.224408  ORF Transcript_94258/g.224408 Transcript_94258/m.224408 type:complete len:234 (+) Transcript_94258:2369-3070(+)